VLRTGGGQEVSDGQVPGYRADVNCGLPGATWDVASRPAMLTGLAHSLLLPHALRLDGGMEPDAPEVLALPSDFEKNNGCRSGHT
jgi:hypothetical protein